MTNPIRQSAVRCALLAAGCGVRAGASLSVCEPVTDTACGEKGQNDER